jgi:hypothetical protein
MPPDITTCTKPPPARFVRRARLLAVAALVLLAAAPDVWAKQKRHDGPKTEESPVVRPDMLAWLQANNPGLPSNFLHTALPDTTIRLSDRRGAHY